MLPTEGFPLKAQGPAGRLRGSPLNFWDVTFAHWLLPDREVLRWEKELKEG